MENAVMVSTCPSTQGILGGRTFLLKPGKSWVNQDGLIILPAARGLCEVRTFHFHFTDGTTEAQGGSDSSSRNVFSRLQHVRQTRERFSPRQLCSLERASFSLEKDRV